MANVFNRAFHIYKYWHNNTVEAEQLQRLYSFRSVEMGRLVAVCNGKTITINKGELLFVPPNIKAKIKFFPEPNTHGTVIRIRYFPDADELEYPIQAVKLTSEIVKLLNQMPNYNTRSNITSLTIANVYEIIYLLQKNMKKYDGKYVPKLEKALAFMRENDKYSIPQLAAYCGMSERRFYATFKQFTGVTPIQMKHKIQGTKAELLLKNTHLSVEEIANEVGFASETHFRKIFKKQCSYVPKDIRKK